MSITATTLVSAISPYDTQFSVASTTGITAPVSTTGSGSTFLYVDKELMAVTGVPQSGVVTVVRGVSGTRAVSHGAAQSVLAGAPTDFPQFQPTIDAYNTGLNRFQGIAPPVAAAATIAASGQIFHVTGTTASSKMTPPTNFVEGRITVIADAVWTWTSATTPNSFAQAGSVTSAGTTVDFIYDSATQLWYPSRQV